MISPRYHIIIDVSEVADEPLEDEQGLQDFLAKLPGLIGMSTLYGPVVIKGIPENPGLTGFVIIDYSHISAHTFSATKEVLVDIFSCKPYEQAKAQEVVLEYLKAKPEQARIKEVYWGN